jgi:transposase
LSAPSTPEGEAELAAWVRANRVGRAVMEASGGYERSWAEALRAAGVEVVIVDPKRIRHFAKAAGRLAKIRSTPRRSPGSPRRFPTARPRPTIPRARRSTGWSRPGRP